LLERRPLARFKKIDVLLNNAGASST